MDFSKLKLCYIDQSDEYSEQLELYFTEQDLDKQWGDDWDDAPYEHNAGLPYDEDYTQPEQGIENGRGIYPKIQIHKVIIEPKDWGINLITPRTKMINSNYSVEDINKGAIPWLVIKKNDKVIDTVMAGTTYTEFIEKYKRLDAFILYEPRLL